LESRTAALDRDGRGRQSAASGPSARLQAVDDDLIKGPLGVGGQTNTGQVAAAVTRGSSHRAGPSGTPDPAVAQVAPRLPGSGDRGRGEGRGRCGARGTPTPSRCHRPQADPGRLSAVVAGGWVHGNWSSVWSEPVTDLDSDALAVTLRRMIASRMPPQPRVHGSPDHRMECGV